jgi:D-alanyl-D-alanine dipeptidase
MKEKIKKGSWGLVDSFGISVGKNGLARDNPGGILFTETLPVKKEGDGKPPAGIFRLGTVSVIIN